MVVGLMVVAVVVAVVVAGLMVVAKRFSFHFQTLVQ